MKRLKAVLVLLVVFSLAMTAFGCTGNVVQTGDLPPDYVVEVNGKIKVTYQLAATESDRRSVNDWVSSFEKKYPDVDVNVEFSTNSNVEAMVAAGNIGDLFFLADCDVYNYSITQRALMPLDSYLDVLGIDVSNVFNAIMDMGTAEGKLYVVMRDYNHMLMSYNKDAIATANLQDPVELDKAGEWTWDTFKSYCEQLTVDLDDDGTKDQVGAQIYYGYDPVWIPFLEGWGGNWYDTVNKKITVISDENVLKGVDEMIDTINRGIVKYIPTSHGSGYDNPKSINATASLDNYNSLSSKSQVIFQPLVFPSFAQFGREYDSNGIEWDIVSWPATPTHKVGTGATGFGVYSGTKNPDAAAALALSLYTEEGQRAYNGQEGGSVPNVLSLAHDSFWRVPFADSAIDEVNGKYYEAFISHPEADTYGRIECILPPDIAFIVKNYMQNIVPDAVNGNRSAADTLAKIEAEANGKWETLLG